MLTLHLDHVRACAKVAANKFEPRQILRGVLVEVGSGFVSYVGTNGHALFTCQHALPEGEGVMDGAASFILDARTLPQIRGFATLDVRKIEPTQLHGLARKSGRNALDQAVVLTLADGNFPHWRKTVPKLADLTGIADQYNPSYLAALADAFEELGAKFPPHVSYNGPKADERWGSAALVSHSGINALGVVMPYRSELAVDLAPLRRNLLREVGEVKLAAAA